MYPNVEVVLARDGPTTVSDAPEVTRMHDAYLQQLLAGRSITNFYSSEFYGDHVSRGLGAKDRRVDTARHRVPISGTQIRADPYAHRRYLDAIVYRDLITKIVFLGAPSTGKTTLASLLAGQFDTQWVPEYGREYWERHQVDRRLTLPQLAEIAVGHRQREDQIIAEANRFLFVDTDATTTFQFSQYYHGTAHPTVCQLANECRTRYQLFFLCDTDIPYDDTWDRSGSMHRDQFQQQIEADLRQRGTPFIKLTGSLACRTARVAEALAVIASNQS